MFDYKPGLEWLQNKSPTRSLGQVAEDCFSPAEVEGIKFEVIRGLTNFYRLQYLVYLPTVDVDKIFSWEQRHSYQLLFDWWTAAFQDDSVPLQYFRQFLARSPIITQTLTTTLSETRPDLFNCIDLHTDALMHAHSPGPSKVDNSSYNSALSALFIHEFLSAQTYNRQRGDQSTLSSLRRNAALEAYCQQVAFESFRGRRINPHLHDVSAESRPRPFICSHQASDPSYPRTVQRGPLIRACSWLDPNASISGKYLSQKDEDDNKLAGWPEYLWDLQKGHAVRTKDLDNNQPDYTAISHTWGRWSDARSGHRLPAETTPKDLFYHIPLNTMKDFNVEKIAEDLHKLKDKVKTEYVWLDLVCLPQGIEGTSLSDRSQQLKNREIARQAWIFRNAKFAIAWLHDVQDLSCLEGIFKLYALSLPHLRLTTEDQEAKEMLVAEALEKVAGPTGLLHPLDSPIDAIGPRESVAEDPRKTRVKATSQSGPTRQASLWFTSLWTLQEACLRPDMCLATANWSIWSLDDDRPVPLNGFLCVDRRTSLPEYSVNAERYRDIKSAKEEASIWELTTGLSQLLELSRADIIRLGDRRYCKERRAEAIMSALGATKWYYLPGSREADLILGKYPLGFVEEVRNLIPGEFFTAYAKVPHADSHDYNRIVGGGFGSEDGNSLVFFYSRTEWGMNGSLLPFSLMGHHYMRHDRTRAQLDVHHSIMSWNFATSGHVGIKKACILSSSTIDDIPRFPKVLTGTVLGFVPGNEMTGAPISRSSAAVAKDMLRERDLHEWTRTRKCEVHLVLVMEKLFKEFQQGDHQWEPAPPGGLHTNSTEELHILKGIVLRAAFDECNNEADFESADGDIKRLVKIGCFDVFFRGTVSLPEAREVHWEVL